MKEINLISPKLNGAGHRSVPFTCAIFRIDSLIGLLLRTCLIYIFSLAFT